MPHGHPGEVDRVGRRRALVADDRRMLGTATSRTAATGPRRWRGCVDRTSVGWLPPARGSLPPPPVVLRTMPPAVAAMTTGTATTIQARVRFFGRLRGRAGAAGRRRGRGLHGGVAGLRPRGRLPAAGEAGVPGRRSARWPPQAQRAQPRGHLGGGRPVVRLAVQHARDDRGELGRAGERRDRSHRDRRDQRDVRRRVERRPALDRLEQRRAERPHVTGRAGRPCRPAPRARGSASSR